MPDLQQLAENPHLRDRSLRRFDRDEPLLYESSTEEDEEMMSLRVQPYHADRFEAEFGHLMDAPLTEAEQNAVASDLHHVHKNQPGDLYRNALERDRERERAPRHFRLWLSRSFYDRNKGMATTTSRSRAHQYHHPSLHQAAMAKTRDMRGQLAHRPRVERHVMERWRQKGDIKESWNDELQNTMTIGWRWRHESPTPEPEDLTPLNTSDMEFTPSEVDALEAVPPPTPTPPPYYPLGSMIFGGIFGPARQRSARIEMKMANPPPPPPPPASSTKEPKRGRGRQPKETEPKSPQPQTIPTMSTQQPARAAPKRGRPRNAPRPVAPSPPPPAGTPKRGRPKKGSTAGVTKSRAKRSQRHSPR